MTSVPHSGPPSALPPSGHTLAGPPPAGERPWGPASPPVRPQLRRSGTDQMIGGVCGGLAELLDVDPVLVRIAFVLLALAGSTGLLLYLLLWAIVPPAGSDRSFAHRFSRRPRD